MTRIGKMRVLAAASCYVALVGAALSAQNHDPDWPCIQRKVPQLSLGQIWNGPQLPPSAAKWSSDPSVASLVRELSARRVPLDAAQRQIRDFAAALPADKRPDRLTALVQGLFDEMNAERSHVISGIARYAHKQTDMAASLRAEASAVDALRISAGADVNEVARRTDSLAWETRIFQERVQSLTYVCEVPTLIEQRLYALAKTISEEIK